MHLAHLTVRIQTDLTSPLDGQYMLTDTLSLLTVGILTGASCPFDGRTADRDIHPFDGQTSVRHILLCGRSVC